MLPLYSIFYTLCSILYTLYSILYIMLPLYCLLYTLYSLMCRSEIIVGEFAVESPYGSSGAARNTNDIITTTKVY